MTAIIIFDYEAFKLVAPLYSNPQTYPETSVENYWNMAINYVSNVNFGCVNGDKRRYAINLMTAHLLYIAGLTNNGTVPYVMQSSTIDKISIGLVPPPVKTQWQWWLSASPYGQQLLALLQANSAGGYYIGGSAPRAAFGYQGGIFR